MFRLRAEEPPKEIGEVPTVKLPELVSPMVELARYAFAMEEFGNMTPPVTVKPLVEESPFALTPPAKVEVAEDVAIKYATCGAEVETRFPEASVPTNIFDPMFGLIVPEVERDPMTALVA